MKISKDCFHIASRLILLFTLVASMYWCQTWLQRVGWPGPHWDSWYFADVSFRLSRDGGWNNNALMGQPGDDGRSLRFIHGTLYPFVLGRIFQCSSFQDLSAAFAAINTITFAAMLALAWPWTGQLTWSRFGSAASLGLLSTHIATQLQGRPEQLSLLIAAPCLIIWRLRCGLSVVMASAAVVVGVLFTTSPILGLIGGMVASVCIAVRLGTENGGLFGLHRLGLFGVASLCVAVIILWGTSPEGPVRWFTDLRSREKEVIDLTDYLFFWIAPARSTLVGVSMVFPLWNVAFWFLISAGLCLLLRQKCYAFSVAFIVLGYLSIRAITDYGSVPACAICLLLLKEVKQEAGSMKVPLQFAWAVFKGVGVICFAIVIHEAVLTEQGGADLENARILLRNEIPRDSVVIYHSNVRPYLGCIDVGPGECRGQHLYNVDILQRGKVGAEGAIDRFFGRRVKFAVLGQTRLGAPPKLLVCHGMEFQLASDFWTQERYEILGFPMPRCKPGVRFALYRRS